MDLQSDSTGCTVKVLLLDRRATVMSIGLSLVSFRLSIMAAIAGTGLPFEAMIWSPSFNPAFAAGMSAIQIGDATGFFGSPSRGADLVEAVRLRHERLFQRLSAALHRDFKRLVRDSTHTSVDLLPCRIFDPIDR